MLKRNTLLGVLILAVVSGGCWLFKDQIKAHISRASGETETYTSTCSNPLCDHIIALRARVISMVLSGVKVSELRFNNPENFSFLKIKSHGVFAPEGGKAIYEDITPDLMANGAHGSWVYNGEIEIPDMKSTSGPESSEIIAYLVGINQHVCEIVNKSAGISGIPKLNSDQSTLYKKNMTDTAGQDYILPVGKQTSLDNKAFSRKPTGCFQSYDGKDYVFYGVILER